MADHAVAQLKERGDPWRLSEEARLRRNRRQPREFEQSLASLEQGRMLIGSASSGTEGTPPTPPHLLPSLSPVSLAGAFPCSTIANYPEQRVTFIS